MSSTLVRTLLIVAAALGCLWPAPALAGVHHETDHFMIYCRTRDYRAGTIKDEDLRRWGEWFEASYTALVKPRGLKFDKPHHPVADHKVRVLVYTFAESDKWKAYAQNPGFATSETGRMHLNMPFYVDRRRDEANKCTVAHELFHLIQFAYDTEEEAWLLESTARWVPGHIFPDIDQARYCLGSEAAYIKASMYPFSFDFVNYDDHPRRTQLRQKIGRPYGASCFFRFATSQANDPEIIRKTWEAAGRTRGGNALEAVARGLGGGAALDEKFRAVYDRFAVGVALHDKAPAECRLVDVGKLVARNGAKVRAPRTDLSRAFLDHCTAQRDPANFAPFTPVFAAAPDLDALARAVIPGRVEGLKGWVAGRGGIRCFNLPKPSGTSAGAIMEIDMRAPQNDLSLQVAAVVAGEVKIFKGAFGGGKHTVRLPDLTTLGPTMVVIAVGYADVMTAVNYPMTVRVVEQSDAVTIGWHPLPANAFANRIAVTAPAPFKIGLNWGGRAPYRGYQYTLYWSYAEGGPWTAVTPPLEGGEHHAGVEINNKNNTMPPNQFLMEDATATSDTKENTGAPRYYVVGQKPVKWDAQGKVIEEGAETRSNIIAPSRDAVVRLQGLGDDVKALPQGNAYRTLQAGMGLKEQVAMIPGAHITVTAGGLTNHYWTPRTENGLKFGTFTNGRLFERVHLQWWWPDDITITVEGGGLSATRQIKVPRPPNWAESSTAKVADLKKELARREADFPRNREEVARMITYCTQQRDFKRDDPSEDAAQRAEWQASLEEYMIDATKLEECTIPFARNDFNARIAFEEGRLDEAVQLLKANTVLAKRMIELEETSLAKRESVLKGALGAAGLKDKQRKSLLESIDSVAQRRKALQTENNRLWFAAQAAVAEMATKAANASAVTEAIAECRKNPEWESYIPSTAPSMIDGAWQAAGDRALAAALWKDWMNYNLRSTPPDKMTEARGSADQSRRERCPWWPEGVAGLE